jgi:hypothetical protein
VNREIVRRPHSCPAPAPPAYFTKGFGYQAGVPSFIARTAYESAEIAAGLNGAQ